MRDMIGCEDICGIVRPFSYLRSLGGQSEELGNDYISDARNVRRIKQQLWFNHRCKDLGLVPAGLRIKSPWTRKKLIALSKRRVDDWFERVLTIVIEELTTLMIMLLCLSKLRELIPTPLLDTLTIIANNRADKTTEQHLAILQSKLTRLQHTAHKKRHKTDKNWVRNISIFLPVP